ncbi:dephospho-CoA kinase [Phytomonospora endophytica]|uniref:Dephospho-CoA kinase n=1 Tax=Phytomonospora endophytica TaxID=714109 RepID=A0A841FUL1_9ACTN|nr:dephospho-CoA kinase [Phytomonospora endophytica]MBB6035660.1 dephospho-CoA kinase [Phytomonospora endophytica]GIG69662.1 dephospho-CoA kinase [Phytomonospora endophytica]
MLRIGLTGGIGSGKSAVAARLVSLGAVLIDSDVLAREVVAPGTPGLAAITEAFGSDVIDTDGTLDRATLAARVFGDPEARRVLESITHPRVRARAAELFAAAPADAIVVNDVPLLAEVGLAPTYHLVIVVETPLETRIARLASRGMPEAEARGRIAAQLDDEGRRRVADAVLDNGGDLTALHTAIDELWRERLVPYERNVREGIRAQRPEALSIDAYDPAWPARFERIAARLRHAMGEAALAVDHIGSTSVPGLPAKDVIDIQVTVADLADAERLIPELADAGFVSVPGIRHDDPKPFAPDVRDWAKRMFGGTDPADITHVHIRAEGTPGQRYALMFRDWLRANDDERDGYADHKHELAATGMTTSDYAEAKEPWFTEILPRLDDWAKRTAWAPARR